MKHLFLVLTLLCQSALAFAHDDHIEQVLDKVKGLLTIGQVHQVGIKFCVDKLNSTPNGLRASSLQRVKCIFIKTDEKTTFLTLRALFGDAERPLDGILIAPEWADPSQPEPRLSVGN